ncbi:hypothetical protein ANSO36C_59110 [Nostoc cf. commune SO-36]|uniref:Uncharacterized protein n=1 Tax=Nostoc cf. commune SO-36 TaxID=449208 RepID=A0ABM7ZA46_NOSCO|nr:hypothetical protein ANSO36C_59110 [Nostoc cf. commune SO-36]
MAQAEAGSGKSFTKNSTVKAQVVIKALRNYFNLVGERIYNHPTEKERSQSPAKSV